MLLSEAQARSRWCPQARIARREHASPDARSLISEVSLVGGCNRDALGGAINPASCRCLGPECMAWRWAGWETSRGHLTLDPACADLKGDRLGYCGLAGQP